jgi:hypothetical protein
MSACSGGGGEFGPEPERDHCDADALSEAVLDGVTIESAAGAGREQRLVVGSSWSSVCLERVLVRRR